MKTNKVIRICLHCKYNGEQDANFTYLGDGVWSCNQCGCKYTEVKEVVDQALKDANGEDYPC